MIKKIVGIFVVALLVTAVAAAVVLLLWDRDVQATLVPRPSEYPIDWQQQIRALSDLPGELAQFSPDSVVRGDAAEPLGAIADAGSWAAYERTYQALSRGGEMPAADSLTVTSSLADSLLDVAFAASAMAVYSGPATRGSPDNVTLLSLPAGPLRQFRGIAFGLLTRSAAHLAADSQAAALADIGAVMRLGALLYRQSASLAGNHAGRTMIALGGDQLGRYARVVGDDTLQIAATALAAWARRRQDYAALLHALGSDAAAALEIARDTDVLSCWRSQAIARLVSLNLRPRNIPFGIPGTLLETVAGLTNIADPGVAWMAEVAGNTLEGFNNLTVGGRISFLRGAAGVL